VGVADRDESTKLVRVSVTSSGDTFATVLAVSADPVHAAALVPALHELDDVLISEAKAATKREGKAITCRVGCTACCDQPVPVTEQEAQFYGEFVDILPADTREAVRERAAATVRALESEGLLPALEQADRLGPREARTLATRYFRMQMPCPFLEGGSCSIYEHRPLSCREYLVTSPSERCEHFGEETVERVPLPVSLISHLTRNVRTPWMPLVLALERSDRHPEPGQCLAGPEHLARLLGEESITGSVGPSKGVADCPV